MKKVSALLSLSALLFSILPVLTVSAQSIAPTQQIAQGNKSAKDYYESADSKLSSGDYPGAVADFDAAIKIDPKYVAAYIYRGMSKVGIRDNQGALADLNTAISLDPKSGEAYGVRAPIEHDFLKDKQGGMSDIVKASELARDRGDMNDYKAAIKLIEKWK